MKKRILLINPPIISKDGFLDRDDISPPLGLLSIRSYLLNRNSQCQIDLIDLNLESERNDFFNVDSIYFLKEKFLKRFEERFDIPDLVGVSSHYSNLHIAIQVINLIKKINRKVKIIIGGAHPTFVAEELLDICSTIDAVCCNEGELSFYQYYNYLYNSFPLDGVKGIKLRGENGKIIFNGDNRLLNENEIPVPDYSILDLSRYTNNFAKAVWIEGGRGCPYKCSFCATSVFWRRTNRPFAITRILSEVKELVNLGVTKFRFTYDNFTTSREYVEHFCRSILTLATPIEWECYSRVDTIHHKQVKLLKSSGCKKIFFGFESTTNDGQNYLNKKYIIHKANKIIKELVENNIEVEGNFIIGLPGQDYLADIDTLLSALKLKEMGAGNIQITYLHYYPGSQIEVKSKYNYSDKVIELLTPIVSMLNVKHSLFRIFSYLNDDKRVERIKARFCLLYLIEYYPIFFKIILKQHKICFKDILNNLVRASQ